MVDVSPTPAEHSSHSLRAALLFSLVPVSIGSLAALIGLALPATTSPWPPLWLFWLVWLVIYPCWGHASYLVWLRRRQADVRGPMALFVMSIFAGLFFMPVAALSANNPGVMTLGDANGVASSCITAWLYTRYSRRSLLFLLPLLCWMPVTLALKIWYWLANT